MTDEVTLLPCPFCGGDGGPSIGQHADGTAWHYVECDDCGASAESAEAWNRRSHLRTPRVEAGDVLELAREFIKRPPLTTSRDFAQEARWEKLQAALSRRPSEAVDGDGKCRGCLGSRTVRYTDTKASCGYRIEPCPDCAHSRRLTGAEREALEIAAICVETNQTTAFADVVTTLRSLADRLASEDGAAVGDKP